MAIFGLSYGLPVDGKGCRVFEFGRRVMLEIAVFDKPLGPELDLLVILGF